MPSDHLVQLLQQLVKLSYEKRAPPSGHIAPLMGSGDFCLLHGDDYGAAGRVQSEWTPGRHLNISSRLGQGSFCYSKAIECVSYGNAIRFIIF